ncbi:MAG: Gfo/Idh/MocA family oxidoreductase [Verrucomicrobia bacterium]|nr:Gfo/Idh/MocA family oxidoreductase [Cytophagales bacterium]
MIENSKSINTALSAFGMSGEVFHAPLLAADPKFKFTDIFSRKEAYIKAKYPAVKVWNNFEAMIQDPDIELVIINTPTHTHFDMAKSALLANKHVVVEKPFTVHAWQAQELINLAKTQNKILTVFHNRRWDGGAKTVKQIVDKQLLGKLVEFESHFDRFRNFIKPDSWKEETQAGSGVLYDLGVHLIDEALQLFGFPEKVTADIKIQRDGSPVIDSFLLLLDYGNHLRVTLKVCYLVREPLPKFILHGTNGSYIKYGNDPQEDDLKAGKPLQDTNWGLEKEENWGTVNTEINGLHFRGKIETLAGSYQDFYTNLYEVIRNKAELYVKPEEAKQAIEIIEMALQQ